MGMDNGVLAIHIKVANPVANDFALIESNVIRAVGSGHRSISWREADSEIFNALAVEKNMTALLLSLISLVAVFCVMNTLLVLTVQKTPAIGLLKALGFSKLEIMSVFMVHGMIQCSLGIMLGLAASWAVLSNLQNIVEWLAKMGLEVFPASVYGLSAIPHRLIVSDIFWVVGLVFVFGVLASLVPALVAASKDPVRSLNRN
jgi:lipoprotein-releasing system permease protein